MRTLVDALYVPQYIDKDRAAIRKGLKENFSEYIGALIKYNKEMYFISKKGPEKSVIGINVETGVETEILKDTIKETESEEIKPMIPEMTVTVVQTEKPRRTMSHRRR